MTRALNFFLHSLLLALQVPSTGFASEENFSNPTFAVRDSVLWLTQKKVLKSGCLPATTALVNQYSVFKAQYKLLSTSSDLEKAWAPWPEDDLEWVEECDSFPCKIKLDKAEVDSLETLKEKERQKAWFKQIFVRKEQYQQTGVRRGYEFEGDLIDPWLFVLQEKLLGSEALSGLFSKAVTPFKVSANQLFARRFDFSKEKMKPIRQVVDLRFESSERGAWIAIRDLYTAHYFDAWGEFYFVECGKSQTDPTLYGSVLVLDLDLLKQTSLISRLSRGSMKNAVEEHGHRFLHQRGLEFEHDLKK